MYSGPHEITAAENNETRVQGLGFRASLGFTATALKKAEV